MDKQQDAVERSELHPDIHVELPDERTSGTSDALAISEGHRPSLPVEPSVPKLEGAREAQIYRELLNFFLTGRRPEGVSSGGALPVPALLYPFRDLNALRYEFPFCVKCPCEHPVAETLRDLVDRAIQHSGQEGDAAQRLTRHFHQLEWSIKQLDGKDPGTPMDQLLEPAIERVVSSAQLPEPKNLQLREDLELARHELKGAGNVLPCTDQAPRQLLEAAYAADWHQRSVRWMEELDDLIVSLENLLSADQSTSREAATPESLRNSVGSAELDFSALSDILSESRLTHSLPEARITRVRRTLQALRHVQPLFGWCGCRNEDEELPFSMAPILNDTLAALECHRSRMSTMVGFFKAVHIARLELQNHYREDLHDPLFEQFGQSMLSDEERALCPPVVLVIEGGVTGKGQVMALLDMLASGAPFKVLVQIPDLLDDPNSLARVPFEANWLSRLAIMATTLNGPFVLQAPLSRFTLMHTGFAEGLRAPGPALFSVYAGDAVHAADLPIYLSSAAALESRVFPAFVFNPTRGTDLADRMDIGANTSVELDWPSEHFTYQGGDGEQKTVQIAMTPADFLLGDKRTARFYWDLPPRHWHPRMMRLTDYLQEPPESREGTIPYVLGVDQQDTVHRLALSRSILEAVEQCRNRWRHLQELGGINNSHAKRLLERESGRLEEEKQQAIAAVEATYRTELDRNLDDLTHEIVGRIASQLLDETPGNIGTSHRAPSRPSAPKSGPTETRPEEPTVDQEAEEEPLSFDDPYIETPRCTTCNECTRLNGQMFMYNENKQAFINDPTAGSYRQLVEAAEKCPVRIIHPGKPRDSAEPGLEELIKRAAPFN